jgi:hypothetical protein
MTGMVWDIAPGDDKTEGVSGELHQKEALGEVRHIR